MKFNSSHTETLVSGDPYSQPSFEANVKAEGVFLARVKRTGQRTKQIGWVELLLLDTERLAVCYADHAESSLERTLVFPLIKGSEFGDVKRHGNSLTLQAVRVSLVLEVEPSHVSDEGSSTTVIGEWSRVLFRLVSGETTNSTGRASYFDGLGISVNASKPSSAPVATPGNRMSRRLEGGTSRPRPKQLVPQPASRPPPAATAIARDTQNNHYQLNQKQDPMMNTAASLSMPSLGPTGTSLPTSRSFKRISLCLAEGSEFKFGEDLKSVLSTLDKAKEEEEKEKEAAAKAAKEAAEVAREESIAQAKIANGHNKHEPNTIVPSSLTSALIQDKHLDQDDSHEILNTNKSDNQFNPPSAPFSANETSGDSEASTPSPNSLYLQSDASSPPLDLNAVNSPKRMVSILAKEQRQYVERYGSRAAALSTYLGTQPNLTPETREPPKIPAPMPSKSTQQRKEKKDADAMSVKSRTSMKPTKAAAAATSSARRRPASMSSIKSTSATSSAKTGPAIRKSVSIAQAPTIHVIKEEGEENDSDNEAAIGDLLTPMPEFAIPPAVSSPSAMSTSSMPSSTMSPRSQQKSFVKVMKKLLGKRKSKKDSVASPLPHDMQQDLEDYQDSELKPKQTHTDGRVDGHVDGRFSGRDESPGFEVLHITKESADPVTPDTPESIEISPPHHHHHHHHHVYADLAAPEINSPILDFKEHSEDEQDDQDESEDPAKANVVASATNNGRLTAAVPTLKSSSSISALSFRSLSSRSLSSRGSDSLSAGASHTAETTPEKSFNQAMSKQSTPIESYENHDDNNDDTNSSPTMLRREAGREELNPTPVQLEPSESPLVSRMYDHGNKSTSALPQKPSMSFSAPHQQQPSLSSSYSSIGSRRSLHSYASSLSSASSFSTPTLMKPSDIMLYSGQLWVSRWASARWNPVSQQELRTEISASDSTTVKISISGTSAGTIKFTPQCEIRRVGNHDIQVKAADETYMFRGRDPDNAQRFYRTLWTLQANGVQPVAAAALASSNSYQSLRSYDEDDNGMLSRRKTLMPPALSKSNQNLRYMGRSTETIIEE